MKLTLHRLFFEDDYTEGELLVDGVAFCDTLEDKTRDYNKDGDLDDPGEKKVYGETAIPFGKYNVIMSYSNRFKKVMPEIQYVKGFEGIRIHAGNSALDSHGCLLTGKFVERGRLGNSRKITDMLYEAIEEAIGEGEKVTIEII